jgi:hypothetical protein
MRICEESVPFLRCGQEADEVEMGPAEERAIVDPWGAGDSLVSTLGIEDSVHGMVPSLDNWGQGDDARLERWLVGWGLEGEPFFPGRSGTDPLPE